MKFKLDQIRLTGNNWNQNITTFERNSSVFSDMQHTYEKLVVHIMFSF